MAKQRTQRAQAESDISPLPPDLPGAPGGDTRPQPKHGTARPADEHGVVPRVVNPLERAPRGSGLSRYKIRVDNYRPVPTRYVLAADRESAEACYLESVGESIEYAGNTATGHRPLPDGSKAPPKLVVVELED